MNIYLDMDDVVADWMKAACEYLDVERWDWGQMLPDHKWQRLKDNQRMYRDLPVREGAKELVDWVTDYCQRTNSGLFFLTAVPHNNDVPWAFSDKVFWAYERFPHIPVFFGPYSHDKWRHCKPGDILIDDRPSNCEEWRRAGGLAYQYKKWTDCKVWLEETLK